jgi:hypothetical protein
VASKVSSRRLTDSEVGRVEGAGTGKSRPAQRPAGVKIGG